MLSPTHVNTDFFSANESKMSLLHVAFQCYTLLREQFSPQTSRSNYAYDKYRNIQEIETFYGHKKKREQNKSIEQNYPLADSMACCCSSSCCCCCICCVASKPLRLSPDQTNGFAVRSLLVICNLIILVVVVNCRSPFPQHAVAVS